MNTDPIPNPIHYLHNCEIFVFGSNLDGAHGKGAALTAVRKFGARYGKAEGLQGQSYALPTVGHKLKKMNLSTIELHVNRFLKYAAKNPGLTFLVTEIGCGLAGHKVKEIAPMFADAPDNCRLPKRFIDIIKSSNL